MMRAQKSWWGHLQVTGTTNSSFASKEDKRENLTSNHSPLSKTVQRMKAGRQQKRHLQHFFPRCLFDVAVDLLNAPPQSYWSGNEICLTLGFTEDDRSTVLITVAVNGVLQYGHLVRRLALYGQMLQWKPKFQNPTISIIHSRFWIPQWHIKHIVITLV